MNNVRTLPKGKSLPKEKTRIFTGSEAFDVDSPHDDVVRRYRTARKKDDHTMTFDTADGAVTVVVDKITLMTKLRLRG